MNHFKVYLGVFLGKRAVFFTNFLKLVFEFSFVSLKIFNSL